jgi:hypothetical protein
LKLAKRFGVTDAQPACETLTIEWYEVESRGWMIGEDGYSAFLFP